MPLGSLVVCPLLILDGGIVAFIRTDYAFNYNSKRLSHTIYAVIYIITFVFVSVHEITRERPRSRLVGVPNDTLLTFINNQQRPVSMEKMVHGLSWNPMNDHEALVKNVMVTTAAASNDILSDTSIVVSRISMSVHRVLHEQGIDTQQ